MDWCAILKIVAPQPGVLSRDIISLTAAEQQLQPHSLCTVETDEGRQGLKSRLTIDRYLESQIEGAEVGYRCQWLGLNGQGLPHD